MRAMVAFSGAAISPFSDAVGDDMTVRQQLACVAILAQLDSMKTISLNS